MPSKEQIQAIIHKRRADFISIQICFQIRVWLYNQGLTYEETDGISDDELIHFYIDHFKHYNYDIWSYLMTKAHVQDIKFYNNL